jgi:16S rRNA (cytosine967-C5)-methyltransferase
VIAPAFFLRSGVDGWIPFGDEWPAYNGNFQMTISPSRTIAFDILRRVDMEGSYASDLLHSALTARTMPADASLATEITLGVLRWRRLLDCQLDTYLNVPTVRLDPEVAVTLRIGLYQLRFLDRVPAHAAVDESVELAKRCGKVSAAGLVNAVLRRASRNPRRAVAEFAGSNRKPADLLGIVHSHPTWMVERWIERFGEERTIALLESNNRPAHMACRVNAAVTDAEIQSELRAQKLEVQPGKLLARAWIVRGGSLSQTEALQQGRVSIQDEASQLVALLLSVQLGQTALDVCSAPGGKTILLAQAAGPAGRVIATDLHMHRLRSMRTQLERCGADNVTLVAVDGAQPLPFSRKFDRILVDAPCSGTGTLARHPEIRWRLRADDLGKLHREQVGLLRPALELLAPGGRLIYSTCSLEQEENGAVVDEVLRGNNRVRVASAESVAATATPFLAAGVVTDTFFERGRFFSTFPATHQADGFFAAVLEDTTAPQKD